MTSNKIDHIKKIHQKLLIPGTKKRKSFGLLERPNLPPTVPQFSYKVLIAGQAGSGKTYFIQRLAGTCSEGSVRLFETIGIEVTHVYWPMKIGNRLMLFRLELWDTGEGSAKRYNHINTACSEAVDGVLVCFSIANKEQWLDVPRLLADTAQPCEKPSLLVVATSWDRPAAIAVSEMEIKTFETCQEIPVLRLPPSFSHNGEESTNIAPIINYICKELWQRDQNLLALKK